MMSNGGFYDEAEQVCRARVQIPRVCRAPDETRYTLSLPTHTESEAIAFLEGLGGDAVGAGRSMRQIGINAPVIRARYKHEVENLARRISDRLA
ncbi:hypothetical protein [Candidatus Thiosymbion oneisti]|uniref:hypothetical protein n=1 Tax=Candidatus Thiosymbion oneisti TaxID=589554 RepID=UPI00114CA38A|nr:hypothetical protein [Candidatus Thiosymbion oneisti]